MSGSREGRKNLTDEQRDEIRRLRASGLGPTAIPRMFGISKACVSMTVNSTRRSIEKPKPVAPVKFRLPPVTDPSLLRKMVAGR